MTRMDKKRLLSDIILGLAIAIKGAMLIDESQRLLALHAKERRPVGFSRELAKPPRWRRIKTWRGSSIG